MLDIREIKQFKTIGGVFKSPSTAEDGKKPTWNNTAQEFDYEDDIKLSSVGRETGTDRVEFTMSDGSKLYLSLGALAWLGSVSSAVLSVYGRTGAVIAQSGDYTADQVTNAFNKAVDDLDNIADGAAYKKLSTSKLAEITSNTAAKHSHTNKSILDLITDAGGGVIPSASQIATWDGYTGTTEQFVWDAVALLLQDATGISWAYDDLLGTLTPTISLSAFTTDNLPEGSTNKYMSDLTQIARTSYTITLPASSDVSVRVSGAVETTDYPTGWTIAADSGVNLLITHTLTDQKIAFVNVWEVDSGERLAKPFSEGYTGILGGTSTVLIEGLDNLAVALRIELIFNSPTV